MIKTVHIDGHTLVVVQAVDLTDYLLTLSIPMAIRLLQDMLTVKRLAVIIGEVVITLH